MKVELAFVFFGALVYIYTTKSETCDGTRTHPCNVTQCVLGNVECVDIMGTHLCTCLMSHQHDNHSCTARTDCSRYTTFADTCTANKSHCVDQLCRCEGSGHNHSYGHGHGHGHGDHGLHLGNGGH